jgi:hypothetical protein
VRKKKKIICLEISVSVTVFEKTMSFRSPGEKTLLKPELMPMIHDVFSETWFPDKFVLCKLWHDVS